MTLTSRFKTHNKREFVLALSEKELNTIVNEQMRDFELTVPDEVYNALSEANKAALVHLVKAADILDKVNLKQDHPDNIRAKAFLEKEAAAGNKRAQKSLKIWKMHNGIDGMNMYTDKAQPLHLFKDKQLTAGKGVYPADITEDELAAYVLAHPEQASAIFGNNTVVKRKGDKLIAEPYSVAYRDEMTAAARELLAAAQATDHEGFAQYLKLQAQALTNDSDPEFVFKADVAWLGLEDCPLEFTIGRESYDDELSSTVAGRPEVAAMLKQNGIRTKNKDGLGVRVGIVSNDSIAQINNYKKHIEAFARNMPLYEQYQSKAEFKMSYADVHLIALTGDYAAARGGITIAQNLPNGDKLSTQLDQGGRNVFHIQVRKNKLDMKSLQTWLDMILDPAQHALYDTDADFPFTIGHEITHSLGPKATLDGRNKKSSLGDCGDMIEENKADMGSLIMLETLVAEGDITRVQADQLLTSFAVNQILDQQPNLTKQPHRYRSLMQLNYFCAKGAIEFEDGGRMKVNLDKMLPTARAMLTEVVQLQLDGNADNAMAFAQKYGAWDKKWQYAAALKLSLKPKKYRLMHQPLRDKLLQEYDAKFAAPRKNKKPALNA